MQETWNAIVNESRTLHVWDNSVVNGMLQTADYARNLFERSMEFRRSARDVEGAVQARMKRQEWLYRPGKRLNLLMHESVLWARVCPPDVLAAQLDRLQGVVGMNTVDLGIVPLGAELRLSRANGFWILDDRLVTVEDLHAELWLEDAETIALYRRAWDVFAGSAVHGVDAQRVIARARRELDR